MVKMASKSRRITPPQTTVARVDSPIRILVASHSHPQLSNGGAEIAAFELYSALRSRSGYEGWFLGCVRDQMNQKLGATISQPFSEREYLYSTDVFDWFKFSNSDAKFPGALRNLLKTLRPDIAHFHHYVNFGVETFLHIRKSLPNCRIVVTLHEYLAICNHYGQMVTKQHRTLCSQASAIRCSGCFPDKSPADFFLRNLYIHRFFDLVDHFISPSNFLAERYVAWGIPREKISVIENVTWDRSEKVTAEWVQDHDGPLRVGFFGQISALKGINVLLDAANQLENLNEHGVVFELFGDYSGQPTEFQEQFLTRLHKVGRNVVFHGRYDQSQVDNLMQSVDLVLTPSIWWENSPVVIQEARRNMRPVVCSNIGGMAEKVRDGLDGFHFPVGNSIALASLLLRLAKQRERLKAIKETMRAPAMSVDVIAQHQRLYSTLVS